jgi:pseudouridine-5'-phosphate glycosidase
MMSPRHATITCAPFRPTATRTVRHNAGVNLPLRLSEEVSDAIASGAGVVALESTIISHGLPTETSAQTAREIEAEVRRVGAVPATIAVVDGVVRIGLDDDQLVQVAEGEDVAKASIRDLAVLLARGTTGATTVASTSYLAHLAGVRVFATGGLGGVHRGARDTWDESADLSALAAVPVTVVCAGVKSILDVPATLERLESLSVAVLGFRTDTFPGFYIRDTGLSLPWRVEGPAEVAAVMRSRDALGLRQAVVLANPIREADEMDRAVHEATLESGLAAAAEADVRGKDVTPFLLAWFHEQTRGVSLAANVALVRANARVAAEIAAHVV